MNRFLLSILTISVTILAQIPDVIKTGEPFRIYPSNTHQTEPFIAVDALDANHWFISGNTTQLNPFFISEGIYVTTDGGAVWRGTDTCSGAAVTAHGGDPGIAIDGQGRYVLVRLGRAPFYGLYSHTSTDKGLTWSAGIQITNHDLERANVVSDVNAGSPYFGRVYATWVRFAPPYAVYIAYSDNAGVTWSAPMQVNNPSQRCAGPDLAIRTDGTVFLTWAGVTSTSPFQENSIGFASSSNGGVNWSIIENAFPVNGITGTLSGKQNIRVNGYPRIAIDNSGGVRNGRVYIVTTQKNNAPAGSDPDVILHYTDNQGASWNAGVRVNGDNLNNGKTQYFPALDIDNNGGVNIMFYDDRTTTNDSTSVFLARSTNGGSTFAEMEISSGAFKPEPVGGLGQGYQGDNIALQSIGKKLVPIWMDNRTGRYQLYTAPLEIVNTSLELSENLQPEFLLEQNYPNPFNPATIIRFTAASSGFSKVTVFDVLGREVDVLFNEYINGGNHSVSFDGSLYNSGVYFYELRIGNFRETKMMNLLK